MKLPIKLQEKPDNKEPLEPTDTNSMVKLHEENELELGFNLKGPSREVVIQTLRDHMQTIAWSSKEVKGIDPAGITHKLNIDLASKPIQ